MKRIAAVLILLIVTVGTLFFAYESESEEQRDGFTAYRLIAHAMGSIRDQPYTNAYEAMIANYEKGTRVFEIDFMLTSDRIAVARHEWTANMSKMLEQDQELPEEKQAGALTHDEFMNTPILGMYQPMDADGIIDVLAQYPDMYIVTDTKEQKDEDIQQVLRSLVDAAKEHDPSVLDRVVVQIYNEPMLETVKEVYAFPSIIYTLYATQDTEDQVVDFVQKNDIDAVTMPEYKVNQNFVAKLNSAGSVTYVHTINDTEQVANYEKWGVYGVYSDVLTEQELDEMNTRFAWRP
ncbi:MULTISPECIES: phosphatidylinositol-specific phospholipase C/glycerophosphodiester phosphodiesterase family protein [unclassified Paenibacillus]|uniref:phosphatidylinositol-specific phospholipase C/glycerophosphodiester phosphodiesterase family protein n=1 Tax=unclassified Paenibacillus TaxID=185978 RepID=UPI000CFC2865|nr:MULTISPECIES: phosphatidylinositol-specific phospholipase C/glycerophosphodiester phosphodiesterase family protein [unclassified Paenibacillus]PRA03330.1 glycerophosphodiester phosphodiesterase [Paenibacillus sp. MYb63]PRA46748.1 glycerophosphodiester phosphodiesterase [Paenibacillus sp. MYb67]QZN76497.1 glycerophosphodiester phosphodiesterase [Paenibacillus sp. DR312]